jgi:hypothetical protein
MNVIQMIEVVVLWGFSCVCSMKLSSDAESGKLL